MVGGDSGEAIVPGHPDKSLLIESVRYTNEDLKMPPKGKLGEAERVDRRHRARCVAKEDAKPALAQALQ